jgi:hypothetical protein
LGDKVVGELAKFSLTWAQVAAFKREIILDSELAQRVSFGLAIRLGSSLASLGEDYKVRSQIRCLEENISNGTKPAEQFKHAPLYPFWHKHFFTPRHTYRNIGDRWGIARGGSGNKDLDRMMGKVAVENGSDPDLWPGLLSHRFIIGGLEERSLDNRLTGDWIIFAKHEGCNYYLDVATHEEGEEPEKLMAKLRASSATEFPFLFDAP